MKIILKGNPLSTGRLYRTHGVITYMTNEGKALKQSYKDQAWEQWQSDPVDYDLNISVHLYFGDKRKRDIDNYHKLSFDALTKIVWVDDSQIQKMVVEKHYDKENPRIEIEIL